MCPVLHDSSTLHKEHTQNIDYLSRYTVSTLKNTECVALDKYSFFMLRGEKSSNSNKNVMKTCVEQNRQTYRNSGMTICFLFS